VIRHDPQMRALLRLDLVLVHLSGHGLAIQ
jgi:hypothetical protein